jgi:hypothetical protein
MDRKFPVSLAIAVEIDVIYKILCGTNPTSVPRTKFGVSTTRCEGRAYELVSRQEGALSRDVAHGKKTNAKWSPTLHSMFAEISSIHTSLFVPTEGALTKLCTQKHTISSFSYQARTSASRLPLKTDKINTSNNNSPARPSILAP